MLKTLQIAWRGRSQAREGREARPRNGEEVEEGEGEGDAGGEVAKKKNGKADKQSYKKK